MSLEQLARPFWRRDGRRSGRPRLRLRSRSWRSNRRSGDRWRSHRTAGESLKQARRAPHFEKIHRDHRGGESGKNADDDEMKTRAAENLSGRSGDWQIHLALEPRGSDIARCLAFHHAAHSGSVRRSACTEMHAGTKLMGQALDALNAGARSDN